MCERVVCLQNVRVAVYQAEPIVLIKSTEYSWKHREVWEKQSEWERLAFDQSLTILYYREITITEGGGGSGRV